MNTTVIKTDRGFATLIALLAMVMLTMLGLAALNTSDDEISIAGNALQETMAFAAAEGGLEKAAAELLYIYDSTGAPPVQLPQGTDSLNNCIVSYATADQGAAVQRTLTSGTLSGLHALIKTFVINSTAISNLEGARIMMTESFETALVPLFQFAVFYNNDLEIAPGPSMTLAGRVHTNGNLYLQSGNGLQMDSYVTAAGNIYHGRKGAGGVSAGDVLINNANGVPVSMQDASGWLESTDNYWYDSSAARWQGRVQDSTHGQAALEVPLNGSSDDPHKLIERAAGGNVDSYEHQASLKIVDGQAMLKVGGAWNDITAQLVSDGVIETRTNQFTDKRENVQVDVTELNVGLMYQLGYAPPNGILYFSNQGGGDFPALRLNNGSQLDAAFTVVSENPVYTNGDYNSINKKPTAILADAVTFLSNAWDPGNYDSKGNQSKSNRPASPTTVNASVMTGNTETTDANYNGGFENLPRFLEVWSGREFTWRGSMVNMWNSVQANGNWSGAYYSPPIRDWAYDPDLDDPNKIPPGTPTVRIFQRVGWSQEYVGIQ